MSFIRPGEKMRFSNYDDSLYAFLSGDPRDDEPVFIEAYNDMQNPEAFCEIMFRILHQSGVEVTLDMVNKVRENRLALEPLEEIGEKYERTEKFESIMDDIEEAMQDKDMDLEDLRGISDE